MKEEIIKWIESFFYKTDQLGTSILDVELLNNSKPYITLTLLLCVAAISVLLWWGTRIFLLSLVDSLTAKTKTKIDDYLVEKKVFGALFYRLRSVSPGQIRCG